MLLNILHTIAITCAVGTNFYIGKPLPTKREKQKAVETYNYNVSTELGYGQQNNDEYATWVENGQTRNLTLNQYLQTYDIRDQYINGQIAMYNSNTALWNGNTIYGTNVVQTIRNPANAFDNMLIHGDGEIEILNGREMLIALKTISNGTLLNNTINLNIDASAIEHLRNQNGIEIPNTAQTKYYVRTLTTRNTNIETYFSTDNYTNKWKNNSLYERLTDVIYGIGGYNNIITDKIENYDYVEHGVINLDLTLDLTYYPNTTTYTLIYIQDRVILPENTTGFTNVWTTGNNDSLSPDFNITLEGTKGINPTTTEIVNVPGVMIDVLGMPFTFVSTAFNLTLFPGTPYELNFSTLFLSLIAVVIFVFLVRLILRVAGSVGS